ncbi:MFS transporter [Blautia sp.]|uniref:MFS transporter n=1 Tax=Blautia sp. TaxID=1955243 RepID=UPI002E7A0B97|nr:MFS transporter [Blautia sp.]MEE0810928.1 MFS transporter [Blautia sp.]
MIDRRKIKYRIKYILGGTNLSHHYFIFLLVHTLFLIFTRIPSVFINTLLMNQTGDVNATLFYNGAIFAACALTMLFSAQIMHWTECRVTAAIGIIGYNLLYLCYILFQGYIGELYWLFGLFNGIADGFYYISYGRMILAYTEIENRDSGMGIISIFSAVVNLSVPLLSGSIISVIGGTMGYVAIFVLAFAVAFSTLLAVFHLPEEKKKEKKVSVRYLQFIKLFKRKPQIFWGLLAETIKGIREGTFLFILNIILYQLIQEEFFVGFNSFLTGAASICCFWFMSHFIRPGNRRKYMIKAVIVLLAANFLCMYAVNPVVIMLFAVVNSFFAGMLEISCYTTFFDVSDSAEETQEYAPELLAFHEVFVVSGRCVGLLIFGIINTISGATVQAQIFSLFIITFIQFATVYCCRKASRMAGMK